MIISIASGKGGTGKTTVATNFAYALQQPVLLLDCDVEEPNAHLFVRPIITSITPVYKPVPQLDPEKCTYCGTCAEFCAYNAIAVIKEQVLIFAELCHGCGGCSLICPENALIEAGEEIGVKEHGTVGNIEFAHGKLNIGDAMAAPVIRSVKSTIDSHELVIMDAPPGTSCSVVTTLLGSDFCLLVTEPTPFGLHDLQLAVDVVRQLDIPFGVVINRADIGDGQVETYCHEEQIPILMTLPNDRRIAEAYSRGEMLVKILPEYRQAFRQLLETITAQINRSEE
jgi:MinD superfamily P-loop ATPase